MFIRKRLLKLILVLGIGGLLILGAIFAYVQIVRNRDVTLPTPTGDYPVGRVIYDWVDNSRPDPFAATDNRELMVWLWYPAEKTSDAPTADYLPDEWRQARDDANGLERYVLQNLDHVHAHALDAASPADGQFPVLIFMPGLGPISPDYTTLIEELASHGYIILSITPTYSSAFTVMADGRVVESVPGAGFPENDLSVAESQRIGANLIKVWGDDVAFGIGQLEQMNTDPFSPLEGHLDMSRLGLWGHSFGGATAAQVCHLDDRCKAGINLDGYFYGDVTQTGLSQPFMSMWSQPPDKPDDLYKQSLRDQQVILDTSADGYAVTIRGFQHFNFTDYPVMFSLPYQLIGAIGSMDGRAGLQIVEKYAVAFFDQYLKGVASPLLANSIITEP